MNSSKHNRKIKLWAVLVWLVIWQIGSVIIGQEILLVSPVQVLIRLSRLIITYEFWHSIGFSFARILLGFLSGVIFGVLLAGIGARVKLVREFLEPLVQTIKSIPVASFIILILVWISSKNLSVVISFLMVFPIIFTNVRDGILNMDTKLLEMADVFHLPLKVRIRYIYVSQVLPFFSAGCSLALGLCWKAGIAAEVIGIPKDSIGENLYNAKVYLNTPDLFAWTLVIIIISVLFEKIFLFLLHKGVGKIEHMK
ncbi:MAG: ABC transporter permease subunit [Lachnospiraceae bacterium]|jgi:NitT/TauT family transport system permease protein|nr:ABC transporter permease subunit [Lachnospiraceae bacterium]